MTYKILFPSGYQIEDELNDNLDIHVVINGEGVFFATIFTIANIQTLMERQKDRSYFWATNLVIVRNMNKETIKNAVSELLVDGYLNEAFTRIGSIEEIYGHGMSFEHLNGI